MAFRKVIATFLVLSMCISSIAQSSIWGRIIDEQSQPMAFANVVLINRTDSVFVSGAVTKDDGTFTIETDKQDGLLKVSSVGYVKRYIDARQGNVGDIQMQPDTQMLGEVTVKGSRPQFKMSDDGMTINIQNSLLRQAGTADDVLSQLPRVSGSNGSFTVLARVAPSFTSTIARLPIPRNSPNLSHQTSRKWNSLQSPAHNTAAQFSQSSASRP